jgi:hypothetical protein
MSALNDGGPAFPVPDSHYANGQVQYGSNGMTLRDYFAAMALQGIMVGFHDHSYNAQTCAVIAYDVADAMLEAREQSASKEAE